MSSVTGLSMKQHQDPPKKENLEQQQHLYHPHHPSTSSEYIFQEGKVCISGKDVEIVPSYRFLGVQLDNKLEWSTNTDAVYKKAMSRLYFLRRLRSFSVCSRMLHMFYQSVMASTIFFAAVCWGAGIKAKDANRLNKLIKKAGSVVGCRLDNLDEVVRDRMVLKLRTIMDNPSHPLHNTVDKLRSSFSNRLLQPRCSKERYRKSFLLSAIRLYNSSKPSQ
ncbi:hypothetical protein D4764_02G0001570 [Takifugu flavidus]|uniref:Alkylated DNA repair protein AlkB homologue 8 N-terminal domain-containing protein n=1 Tax=Takifugu flavidus TaxID=433684 RepID=A0A5C6NJ26_9TELE|nr:hypothetical protein D4764_02G0001570 [Takifugu flavidus]